MRRTSAIAGACAVIAPLLLAGASSASAATNGSLTITTLGRDGKAVTTETQVIGTNGVGLYDLTSGKAHSLPKGTYDVLASIQTDADETETLGGTTVTVPSSGSAKVTIDARKGKEIRTTLSPSAGAGYTARSSAALCGADGGIVGGEADPGDFYVIPSANRDFALGYSTVWTPVNATGAYYLDGGEHRDGLPSGVSATFQRSSLAAVKISARSGPDTGDVTVGIQNGSNDPCLNSTEQMNVQTQLPTWFTAYVPAGSWSVDQEAQDYTATNNHTYSAGKTYDITLNHAVWGPDGVMPNTSSPGHRLYFADTDMFADPSLPQGGGDATTAWKLSKAGKTLYSRTITPSEHYSLNVNPVIPSAGWYTITADAKRTSSRAPLTGVLSTTSTLSLHFYANPDTNDQIRDYVAGFWPDALNTSNQAAPGSTTPISITPRRDGTGDPSYTQLSDSVKSISAWDSTDGGKTWHAITVKHSGTSWTTSVPNPATGRVSLRSTITDTHGDASTTTVYNAYAIG